ncbi:PD-(D/E)XK nuclease family protein [Brevibacterium marinum]|uniref:Superfamily I DNA/RNA helicase n=1 Tax=Brevibacterium marinum TaxID=418643 RepID=A0A846S424_9MICO|nr:PD-(D/E)XK nuclease family protein [Brevibacterium marinum]NJC57763.1 superfamily I DNA/RNA helicase [Brevibacterium marinum]
MDDVSERICANLIAGESATVVGRPGSGKTRMLESVYARLMSGTSPASVLVLTPDRDHADVLRNRLAVPKDGVLSSAPARSISSFAYGIARAAHTTQTGDDLEFISGADQDVFLADLLAGHELGHGRGPAWPAEITAEVRSTSAFRTEVRDVLNRVMEFDFGVRVPAPVNGDGNQPPEHVFDFGRSALARVLDRHRDPRWEAVAEVLDEYLDIMSMPGYGGTDSATVLARAAFEILREPAEVTAGRRWTFAPDEVPTVVLADAVQDFPAASWGLLQQLRERGSALALFGSPETVTGRFHGADASIIDRSAADDDFATVVLPEVGNTDPEVVDVSDDFGRRITARWGLGHMPRPSVALSPSAEDGPVEDAVADETQERVETHVFEGAASSYRYLARRVTNFVEDGHTWSDVAVLCRNTSTARVVANELRASGVATADIVQPLSIDPATAPLLELLSHPPNFDDDEALAAQALSLAGSIYVRLDPVQIRRFKRVVRKAFPAADSATSLARALRSDVDESSPPGLAPISAMLHAAAAVGSLDPHQALWTIWDAAGVAAQWQREALREPDSDANTALDSVLRLFTLAEKISDRGGFTARSFAGIVAEQDIAQDSLAEQAGADDHVHVGTPSSLAHLRVPLVIIAEVNDGVWPNPKIRGGILGIDDLNAVLSTGETVTNDPGYHTHAKRKNLREEGELFYTALTRAEEHIIVTAISDADRNPSPFFDVLAARTARGTEDADGYAITHEDELLPLSLSEMAAHTRARLLAAASAPEAETPEEDVGEWAQLMAALTATGSTIESPERWREAEDITSSQPLYTPEDTVRVSPSQVESFTDCALRWFLTRNGGDRPGSLAQSLGTIVHAAAENYPQGPASAIREYVDREFTTLEFDAEWERDREHALAMKMADRLGEYIKTAPGEPIGVEVQVYATGVDESGQEWKVTGRLDRVEQGADGIRIVDFKTGKNAPTGQDMPRHAQLGVYQEAINSGTITIGDDQVIEAKAYGAELVFLRYTKQKKREQSALEIDEDPGWARDLINDVSGRMRAAEFQARVEPQKCLSCPVRTSCPAIGPQILEES